MDTHDLLNQALQVGGTALLAMLCYGIHRGAAWLAAKTKATSLQAFWARADDLAERVVKEVYQSYSQPLIAADKFDATAQAIAKKAALAKLKSYLGADGLHALEYLLGAGGTKTLDEFLGTFIEAAVHDTNAAVTAAAAVSAAVNQPPLPTQGPPPAASAPVVVAPPAPAVATPTAVTP